MTLPFVSEPSDSVMITNAGVPSKLTHSYRGTGLKYKDRPR